MPQPKGSLLRHRDWSDAHELQLLTGHSYFAGEDWGPLSQLIPDQLREIHSQMLDCWSDRGSRLISEYQARHGAGAVPWFCEYAGPDGFDKLAADLAAIRHARETQTWRNNL